MSNRPPAQSQRLARFDLGGRGCDVYMEADETGEYVLYEDAMKIIRDQQAALERLVTLCDKTDAGIFSGDAAYDEARAVLAKWRID